MKKLFITGLILLGAFFNSALALDKVETVEICKELAFDMKASLSLARQSEAIAKRADLTQTDITRAMFLHQTISAYSDAIMYDYIQRLHCPGYVTQKDPQAPKIDLEKQDALTEELLTSPKSK